MSILDMLRTDTMIESITLLGSSSGRNAGDAALIAGIMDAIDSACGRKLRYEIPTINPKFIRENYHNNTVPISMLPWSGSVKLLGWPTWQSILRTDLTLVFDAILFDRSLLNPLFNYLSTLWLMLPAAKRRGRKLGFYNVSAGPVTTPLGRRMLSDVASCMNFITVRDQASFDLLNSLGLNNSQIIITADAALTMSGSTPEKACQILSELGFARPSEILGINVSAYLDTWAGTGQASMGKEKFLSIYANALNNFLTKNPLPVLFVSTQHHDEALTRELMSLVKGSTHQALVSNRVYSHYDIRAVLGEIGLLFGMRLHATILASAGLTPVLALPHQPKVSHYFSTLGLDDYVLTFKDFSVENMAGLLARGWAERSRIRTILESSIPVSRAKALEAAKLVASLHSI